MAKKAKMDDMKLCTISCKMLGSPNCGFSVTTHSIDEAKKATFAHARYAHPEIMAKMSETEKHAMLEKIDNILVKK